LLRIMVRRAAPDWRSDAHQFVAEGDLVVEHFTARGTHTGDLMGVPGTGEEIVLRGINIFRVADDKIVERWSQLDQLGLLRQLGLAPARPGRPATRRRGLDDVLTGRHSFRRVARTQPQVARSRSKSQVPGLAGCATMQAGSERETRRGRTR
jgi:hypothetical protein